MNIPNKAVIDFERVPGITSAYVDPSDIKPEIFPFDDLRRRLNEFVHHDKNNEGNEQDSINTASMIKFGDPRDKSDNTSEEKKRRNKCARLCECI